MFLMRKLKMRKILNQLKAESKSVKPAMTEREMNLILAKLQKQPMYRLRRRLFRFTASVEQVIADMEKKKANQRVRKILRDTGREFVWWKDFFKDSVRTFFGTRRE